MQRREEIYVNKNRGFTTADLFLNLGSFFSYGISEG